MRRYLILFSIVTGATVWSLGSQAAETAKAQLKTADGKDAGVVEIVESPSGAILTAKLKGLPPGTHAFHIHGIGKCEAPFKSAGGHFNPDKAKHGLMTEEGPHAGDMPNIHVAANGELMIEIWNPMVTLIADQENSLMDSDGSAIVIHQGPDDYKSNPAGAAGPRIACGVIKK
ncbi:MAG: superoxide dismutase family protein [Methyloligellaceae bacterium]